MSAIALALRRAPWAGEWGWTFDAAADTTTLTAPVVTTFAAWIAYRWHGTGAITDSSPRGYLLPWHAAVTSFAVGLLALLISSAAAVAYSCWTGPVGGPLHVAQFLPATLILGVCGAAGALIGTLLPHLLAIAICPFATFAAAALGFAGIGPKLLRIGGATAGLGGVSLRSGYVVAQSAGLLGLTAALVLVCLLVKRSPLPVAVAVTLLALSLALFGAGSVALMRDGERFTLSSESATDCTRPTAGPAICSMPSHRRAREKVSPMLQVFATHLRSEGFPVPDRYAEPRLTGEASDRGWLVLPGDGPIIPDTTSTWTAHAAISAALPARCGFWSQGSPPSDEVYMATVLLSEWILTETGHRVVAWTADSEKWLSNRSVDRKAWALATYTALKRCEVADIRLPEGVGTL